MLRIPSKTEWQLIVDFTFIRNRMPENTPVKFRCTHTKGFLHLLHPNLDIDDETLTVMTASSSQHPIDDAYYHDKIEEYFVISGVSLHHILVATQTKCAVCGSRSKPDVSKMKTVTVYSSLNQEPRHGTVIPTRCTKSTCRHRGNYGWDVIPAMSTNGKLFRPLESRHTLPYWESTGRTVFLISMIAEEMLPQVLWNHAASLNMANQANWLLGHPEKLTHTGVRSGNEVSSGHPNSMRVGIERRQLQRAFLQYLYHRTVVSLGGSIELLSCRLPATGRKPSLNDIVKPHLDKFIHIFHDRWYRDHKNSISQVPGHGIFEMYDGQWTMVRVCCAVEWCGVVDVGQNRIRRSCRNSPQQGSAFCSSCLQNRCTTQQPSQVEVSKRMDFVSELQRMKYLKQGEFFIEEIHEFRVENSRREVKVKWVGYSECTWEPMSVLSKVLKHRLKTKIDSGEPSVLSVNEIWDDFFDNRDSAIFDTKAAKMAYTCNTNKDVVVSESKGKKRNRVAALCIGVGSDGVVESVYESFRSESLSQLWLHRLYLTKRYPQLPHNDTIVGYDDGCHYHAFVTHPKRAGASPEAGIIARQTVIIDNCHLRGHSDPRCKEKFDPKKHPLAKDFNTQVAEQTFSWFHRFKHIGRYMALVSYWVFIIGNLNERNLITVSKQNVKGRRVTKRKRGDMTV